MQSLANSGVFWGLLIAGIIAVYLLPTIVGLIRGVDRLGLVVLLNLLGWMVWPAALILAFGPRRLPPPAPAPAAVYPPLYPYPWPEYGPADSPIPGPWYPQERPR